MVRQTIDTRGLSGALKEGSLLLVVVIGQSFE